MNGEIVFIYYLSLNMDYERGSFVNLVKISVKDEVRGNINQLSVNIKLNQKRKGVM